VCLSVPTLRLTAAWRRGGVPGRAADGVSPADAALSAWYSSSARLISAAATLLSNCCTVAAPGIAATAVLWIAQASAICAGVAAQPAAVISCR